MSAEVLSRINHDPKDPGSLGRVSGFWGAPGSSMPLTLREKQSRNTLEARGLYAAQAGATSVYQEPHLCGGDWCSMAGRLGRYAGYRQAEQRNEVLAYRDWCIFQVRLSNPGPLQGRQAITAAFGQVLTTANPRHPRRLQTDKGKEFFNSNFQANIKRHDIYHFASESDQTAAVVKRFNRTIKTRILTYLSDRGTVSWVDVIQNLVNAYNHSRHRSIGMAPADV